MHLNYPQIYPDGGFSSSPPYTLPVATDMVLGGIKVGNSLDISESGVLNANINNLRNIKCSYIGSGDRSGIEVFKNSTTKIPLDYADLRMIGFPGFVLIKLYLKVSNQYSIDTSDKLTIKNPNKFTNGDEYVNIQVDNSFEPINVLSMQSGSGNSLVYSIGGTLTLQKDGVFDVNIIYSKYTLYRLQFSAIILY